MIAIDPGFAASGKGCACALFIATRVVEVFFARRSNDYASGAGLSYVVVERPQVDARTEGRVRSIVDLAWAGAALAYGLAGTYGAEVVELTPSAWKGSQHKPQHHGRLWAVLDSAERDLLGGKETEMRIREAKERGAAERWRREGAAYYPRGWLAHNLLDAAALGCHFLGRL